MTEIEKQIPDTVEESKGEADPAKQPATDTKALVAAENSMVETKIAVMEENTLVNTFVEVSTMLVCSLS